ncbi:MAG: methyltransferase domain-containing protein [Methanolobus sp.]|nr:methyltransferase domain-containing protein [Methanolobus sp.]
MKTEIKTVFEIVNEHNQKKDQWSYLTSIEYMLGSKLYVDSLCYDSEKVAQYMPDGVFNMLDFGTGSGIFAILLRGLSPDAKLFAIDANKDESQKDPNFSDTPNEQKIIWSEFNEKFNIDFNHYDGVNIPFPDNTFDIITAYAVIEHVPLSELDKVMNEIKRVLKSDGLLFVFKTPRKLAYTEYLAGFLRLGRHEKLYGDNEVRSLFEKHQLDVIENWKSDMVFEFPGKITNPIYSVFKCLDFLLYHSPFQIFAHHNNFVLKKRSLI